MDFSMRIVSDFGSPCKLAVEVGIAFFVQSALVIAAGLVVGRIAKRSSPVSLRSLYRAVLASAGLACVGTLVLMGHVPALGGLSLPNIDSPTIPKLVSEP